MHHEQSYPAKGVKEKDFPHPKVQIDTKTLNKKEEENLERDVRKPPDEFILFLKADNLTKGLNTDSESAF